MKYASKSELRLLAEYRDGEHKAGANIGQVIMINFHQQLFLAEIPQEHKYSK